MSLDRPRDAEQARLRDRAAACTGLGPADLLHQVAGCTPGSSAAARAHHQPVEGGEPHGGVEADARPPGRRGWPRFPDGRRSTLPAARRRIEFGQPARAHTRRTGRGSRSAPHALVLPSARGRAKRVRHVGRRPRWKPVSKQATWGRPGRAAAAAARRPPGCAAGAGVPAATAPPAASAHRRRLYTGPAKSAPPWTMRWPHRRPARRPPGGRRPRSKSEAAGRPHASSAGPVGPPPFGQRPRLPVLRGQVRGDAQPFDLSPQPRRWPARRAASRRRANFRLDDPALRARTASVMRPLRPRAAGRWARRAAGRGHQHGQGARRQPAALGVGAAGQDDRDARAQRPPPPRRPRPGSVNCLASMLPDTEVGDDHDVRRRRRPARRSPCPARPLG